MFSSDITKFALSVSTFKTKYLIQHKTMYPVYNGTLMEKCLSLAYDILFNSYLTIRESITPAILLNTSQNISRVASSRATHHRFILSLNVLTAVVYLPLPCNFNGLSVWMLAITDFHCPLNCLMTFANAF